jgi:hypothetical protein
MSAHLRVYRFESDAVFEGGLVGAIERMQLAGGVTLLDALFVSHDEASGEFAAVDLASGRAGGTFASMLDFRLDPGRRQAITERTLADHLGGVPRELIEEVAATLEAGAAIFVVLHTGDDATTLEDAVERCRGRSIAAEPVDATTLAQVSDRVSAAAASG